MKILTLNCMKLSILIKKFTLTDFDMQNMEKILKKILYYILGPKIVSYHMG